MSVTHEVKLPDIDSTVPTELKCDIQPGALKQRYSVQWIITIGGFRYILFNNGSAVDTFNVTLSVSSYDDGTQYQCEVTIQHDDMGLTRLYEGGKIFIATTLTSEGKM